MVRPAFAFSVLLLACSMSSAAIIYAPVQYQYRDSVMSAPAFYYGGDNPQVLEQGEIFQQRYNMGPTIRGRSTNTTYIGTSYATEGRFGFNLAPVGIVNIPPAVTYSDVLPAGVNAYPYGFSAADARNQAYASVPLSFRKGDLLASAIATPDGHLVVPASAPLPGSIEIKPYRAPTTQPATAPSTEPILIIPKGLLKKHIRSNSATVALAR